ncbi:Hypothetical protein R9X50_00349300 [Acrodontium crateriforme]|uniref:Alpha/beta hydrolase fold-3 domain-containing protein n=1 Tax=Acrodontium crateriforme TaxID=150365 RepID=A0AAQ3M3R1_9PEZI|nr:Hypothetical protein R9X50_00349300 [Acrodontium crateriforme]
MDTLLLLPKLGFVGAKTLGALLTSSFRGEDDAPTVTEHVMLTALRTMFTNLTYGQLQTIMPPFVNTYARWCKAKCLTSEIVNIPNTSIKGFWLGDKDKATHVMVYFHGGGFVMPGVPQHLDMLNSMIEWSNGKLAVFCNAYTLAPTAAYPTQIGESVEALRYVLSQPGRLASNCLIGGDSAGGNLVLAILSHVSGHTHPNASIVKPLKLDGKLHGALAISPWTSSESSSRLPSSTKFFHRDCVNSTCAQYWINLYKGGLANPSGNGVDDNEFIVPEQAKPEWWKDVQVESLLTTVGEQEVLRDAILSWAEKFSQGTGDVLTLVKGKREPHDGPLTPTPDAALNAAGAEESCSNAAIRTWAFFECHD